MGAREGEKALKYTGIHFAENHITLTPYRWNASLSVCVTGLQTVWSSTHFLQGLILHGVAPWASIGVDVYVVRPFTWACTPETCTGFQSDVRSAEGVAALWQDSIASLNLSADVNLVEVVPEDSSREMHDAHVNEIMAYYTEWFDGDWCHSEPWRRTCKTPLRRGVVEQILNLDRCFVQIKYHEGLRRHRYKVIMRLRSDTFFWRPIPAVNLAKLAKVIIPECAQRMGVNDKWALVPRRFADTYFSMRARVDRRTVEAMVTANDGLQLHDRWFPERNSERLLRTTLAIGGVPWMESRDVLFSTFRPGRCIEENWCPEVEYVQRSVAPFFCEPHAEESNSSSTNRATGSPISNGAMLRWARGSHSSSLRLKFQSVFD